MNRKTFIIIFIFTHIFFIGLHIHKQNLFIGLSYDKQKKEKLKEELTEKNRNLTHQRYAFANLAQIKEFAHDHLAMEPIKIGQVKKLTPS